MSLFEPSTLTDENVHVSQQASGQSFLLVEAVIDVATKLLRIVTKVEDLSLVQQFDTYLRTCLEDKWIEAQ